MRHGQSATSDPFLGISAAPPSGAFSDEDFLGVVNQIYKPGEHVDIDGPVEAVLFEAAAWVSMAAYVVVFGESQGTKHTRVRSTRCPAAWPMTCRPTSGRAGMR